MNVCIIGNNLTSLILAYILSKRKINSEIYSSKFKIKNFKTRSLGISTYNLNYLCKYFKGIDKKTNPIHEIKVLIDNSKIKEKIHFKKDSSVLFNMIKYDELHSFINTKIKKNKYISFKVYKTDSDLNSFVSKKKFNLIINCEKQNCLSKKFLKKGINKNYFNKAFTTIIEHKKINNNIATQIFTEFGPLAFLPLSKQLTSIVYSLETKIKNNISEKKIIEIIKKYNNTYKIRSYKNFESFDLKLSLPKKYYYNNILFFGDSIHSIHPLAGQGFNMIIRDIINFIELIDIKISLGLNVDKSIYQDFEKKVKGQNFIFSLGIDTIYEFFKINKKLVPKKMSEKIFNYIDGSDAIKNLSIKYANQGIL